MKTKGIRIGCPELQSNKTFRRVIKLWSVILRKQHWETRKISSPAPTPKEAGNEAASTSLGDNGGNISSIGLN